VIVVSPRGAVSEEELAFVQGSIEQLPPGSRLVVSLKDVPYLDSRALEYFCDLNHKMPATGQRLKFAETPQACREVFEVTDLSGEFEFYATVEDAVRSFL